MNARLLELQRILSSARRLSRPPEDEDEAARRFEAACRLVPSACPRCRAERLYELGGERLRCASCRHTFRPVTGRWLGRLRVPPRVWLAAVRCFALGLGGKEAASLCGVSQPTAYRALETIRLAIAWKDPEWASLIENFLSGGEVEEDFVVTRREGMVRVRPASVGATPSLPVPSRVEGCVRAGDGNPDPFLAFLRNRLAGYFGLRPNAFPFYAKELELRFNRGGRLQEGELLEALAQYGPASGDTDAAEELEEECG